MSTASEAEDYVKKYFRDQRGIDLVRVDPKETGFDFRSRDNTLFVEVKGTKFRRLSEALFRYFSNSQHEKGKECLRSNKTYEIHIVLGVGTPHIEHYEIPAKYFIEQAKPEVRWWLPLRKDGQDFRLDYGNSSCQQAAEGNAVNREP